MHEESVLTELQAIKKTLESIDDKLTLYSPPGLAKDSALVWSCGHFHATRDEADACAQAKRREAARR